MSALTERDAEMKTLEHYQEEREQAVKDEAARLYINEYSPYKKENFEQFMREMVEESTAVDTMFAALQGRQFGEKLCDLDKAVTKLGALFISYLLAYWGRQALIEAEKSVPSAVDAMGDDRGSRNCDGR